MLNKVLFVYVLIPCAILCFVYFVFTFSIPRFEIVLVQILQKSRQKCQKNAIFIWGARLALKVSILALGLT